MTSDAVAQLALGLVITLAGGIQVYMLREILSLRRSKHLHATVLQRHVGRFARIAEVLQIEWKDLEGDLTQ